MARRVRMFRPRERYPTPSRRSPVHRRLKFPGGRTRASECAGAARRRRPQCGGGALVAECSGGCPQGRLHRRGPGRGGAGLVRPARGGRRRRGIGDAQRRLALLVGSRPGRGATSGWPCSSTANPSSCASRAGPAPRAEAAAGVGRFAFHLGNLRRLGYGPGGRVSVRVAGKQRPPARWLTDRDRRRTGPPLRRRGRGLDGRPAGAPLCGRPRPRPSGSGCRRPPHPYEGLPIAGPTRAGNGCSQARARVNTALDCHTAGAPAVVSAGAPPRAWLQ